MAGMLVPDGQDTFYDWLKEGMVYESGDLAAEATKWMEWEDTASPDAWKNEGTTESLDLGPTRLDVDPPTEQCPLHHHTPYACPAHGACRDPMTLVFPIEERAGAKPFSFRDMGGVRVRIAPRRYFWLKEIHGTADNWWQRITQQPRMKTDYLLLSPETRRLLTTLGFHKQALATAFNAARTGTGTTYRHRLDGTPTPAELPLDRQISVADPCTVIKQ
jgi:hypothetical protein